MTFPTPTPPPAPAPAGAPAVSGDAPADRELALTRAAAARRTASRATSRAIRWASLACPGDHDPTQHRDGKGAWCRWCGRSALGVQVVDR